MRRLLVGASLTGIAIAASRTSPPAGCLVVSKTPVSGQYGTLQSAVSSLSITSTAPQCIFIAAGTYTEQVLVPARAAPLTIYGATTDTTTHAANSVIITNNKSQASTGLGNDEIATLRIKAADFRMYNINVANTYGRGSQAVALSAYSDSGFYGCVFKGYQDTVLSNVGKQLYARCRIEGATDFIFGQRAASWFESCDIRVLAASTGYITANGRDSSSNPSIYVFNNSNIAAADGASVAAGAYYLGRPWREYSRVIFQRCRLGAVINAAGWKEWNSGDSRTCCVTYGEYANSGTAAAGPRASFATKLTAPVTIGTVLGGDFAARRFYDVEYMQ